MIAIKNIFDSQEICLPNHQDCEICCSRIIFKSASVIIACLYIPPASNITTINRYLDAISFIESLLVHTSDTLLIFGDFNLPGIDWVPADADSTSMFPASTSSLAETELVDRCLSLGLHQINNIRNHQGRLLDLIFTNCVDEKCVINTNDILVPLDNYHPALDLLCNSSFDSNEIYSSSSFKFDFKNANYASVVSELTNYDCSSFMLINDIEDLCAEFYRLVYAANFRTVPVIKVRNSSNYQCPWMTPEIYAVKSMKNRVYRTWRMNRNNLDFNNYKHLKSLLKSSLATAYLNYIRDIQNGIKSSPSNFWSYIKTKNKSDGFPNVFEFNNEVFSDPLTISNLFATYFESLYAKKITRLMLTISNMLAMLHPRCSLI